MAGAAAEFDKFDALQFNFAFYFSSSFTKREEFLGRSTWIFDQAEIGKIHLDQLFKAKNAVAGKFNCDRFQESFKRLQATSRAACLVPPANQRSR